MWSRNIRFNKSNVPFCTLKRNLFLSNPSGDIVIPGSASARLIIDLILVHDSEAEACLYNRALYSLSSFSPASQSSFAITWISTNLRVERDIETIKQSLSKLAQSEVKFELLLKTQESKTDKVGLLGTGVFMVLISAIVNFIATRLNFNGS